MLCSYTRFFRIFWQLVISESRYRINTSSGCSCCLACLLFRDKISTRLKYCAYVSFSTQWADWDVSWVVWAQFLTSCSGRRECEGRQYGLNLPFSLFLRLLVGYFPPPSQTVLVLPWQGACSVSLDLGYSKCQHPSSLFENYAQEFLIFESDLLASL